MVTFLLALLTMALPAIKEQARKILYGRQDSRSFSGYVYVEEEFEDFDERQSTGLSAGETAASRRVLGVLYWVVHSLLQVVVMLLVMTMNGYVMLSVIAGFTLGFVLFDKGGRPKP